MNIPEFLEQTENFTCFESRARSAGGLGGARRLDGGLPADGAGLAGTTASSTTAPTGA